MLAFVCLATGVVAGLLLGSRGDSEDKRVNAFEPAERPPPAAPSAVASAAHHLSLAETADLNRQASIADTRTLPALIESIQSRLDGPGRLDAMTVIYGRFAELDPRAAFDHAMANGMALGSPWSDFWADAIFREWARQDLQGAIAHAGQLIGNDVALTAILSARPDLPGAEQSAIIRQLTFGEPPLSASGIAAMADDPAGLFERLDLSMHDARRAVATVWTLRNGRVAVEALDAKPDWASRRLAKDMIPLWASRSPDEALTWALNREAGERRNSYLGGALRGIAASDPQRAATMAAGLADPESRQGAISSVLSAWVQGDPAAAIAWFETITDPEVRRQASATIASRYGRRDPHAAVRWAATLPDGEADAALSRALSWMAREGAPQEALEYTQQISDPGARQFATSTTVSEWAKTDPQAAYRWASDQADPAVRSRATDTALFAWGMTDREGLKEMLDGIVDPAEYERVARTAWRFLSTEELEGAMARVSDEGLKAQMAQHLQRSLGWTDPARADEMTEVDDERP